MAPSSQELEDALSSLGELRETLGEQERERIDQVIAVLSSLGNHVSELSDQVRQLLSAPYRRKSETVAPGQLAMDLLNALAFDREPPAEPPQSVPEPPRPKAKRQRRGKLLRVQTVECRLTGLELACPCCGRERDELRPDIQRRFEYQPATMFVLEEHRYKYACRRCDVGVDTAPAELPAKPIPGSMASATVLAFLAVSKVLDGMPIERIARGLRRHGVDLATSTLNDWFGEVGRMLAVLHTLLHEELLRSQLISLDDTPLKAQHRDPRKPDKTMINGRQWLFIGDIDRIVYARFSEDWKGSHPRDVLGTFDGAIQGDGYAGINPLFLRDSGPTRVGCNDHARRKFVAALKAGDTRAQRVIDIYSALYAIERDAAQQRLDPAGRAALRQTRAGPLWEQLEAEISALAPQAGSKSPLGKAVTYFVRQLPTLKVYLSDGRLPISNAHVERLIRLIAILRKNSMFVGSTEAGHRYAAILTLLLNCVLVGANPYDYLVDVISKIADGWPADRAAELLPRQWLEARQSEDELHGQAATAAV